MAATRLGGISVQPSRFAIIAPDSDSDENENWHSVAKKPSKSGYKDKTKPSPAGNDNGSVSKTATKNAKRRAKKRNQESSSSDQQLDGTVKHDKYSQWLEKDKVLVEKEFEKNLETALVNSVLEKSTSQVNDKQSVIAEDVSEKMKSKCKKSVTLSLQDFQNSDFNPHSSTQQQNGNLGIATCSEEDFFASTEENVKKELQKIKQVGKTRTDSRNKQSKGNIENESVRIAQLRDDLDKKDTIIIEIKEHNNKLEEELREVKKRNQVLYRMLSKGEISSKSELLQQLEELAIVKNELSTEVERLHKELEQERSKNKIMMKSEQLSNKTHSKH